MGDKVPLSLRALILYRHRRFINHLLTYLLKCRNRFCGRNSANYVAMVRSALSKNSVCACRASHCLQLFVCRILDYCEFFTLFTFTEFTLFTWCISLVKLIR